MPDYLKILIPSVIGLATTIFAAFLSARWAVRRAFEERWWKRKEKAYIEIIEALHDLIRYSSLCAEECFSEDGEHPKKKEFGKQYLEAYWKIQKMTDIGAFVISDKASDILNTLRDRPRLEWGENPEWEIREAECKYYREALVSIRKCAKTDLEI